MYVYNDMYICFQYTKITYTVHVNKAHVHVYTYTYVDSPASLNGQFASLNVNTSYHESRW